MTMNRPKIDPQSILTTLGDYSDALCIPLTGGADAQMWRIETPHQRYALRLLGPDQASQAERETRLSRWSRDRGLPVPGVIASGICQGCPVYLMDWVNGKTIAEAILDPHSIPDDIERLGREFGALQARIHALDPPSDTVLKPRDWRTWERLDEELASRLDRFEDSRSCLIHLDYHPLNVLAEHGEVTAVLDWANAHTGDPRVDLARTCSILQLAPLPDPDAAHIVSTFETAWRTGYAAATGNFDLPPLLLWWAGAAMEQDLTPRLNSLATPWLTDAYIARIRQWTHAARGKALELD